MRILVIVCFWEIGRILGKILIMFLVILVGVKDWPGGNIENMSRQE